MECEANVDQSARPVSADPTLDLESGISFRSLLRGGTKRDVDAVCHTFTTPARRKDNTEQITFVASLEQQPENTALVSCRPLSLCEGWVLTPESLKE